MAMRLAIVSDIHYAGPAEQARRGHESRAIANPPLRLLAKAWRHFVWLRDPFAHNHLLDEFLQRAGDAYLVVANGDFSCDTEFIGVSDDAARASAAECLGKLRAALGARLHTIIGDHELGKMSLFGGRGGLRLASWRVAGEALGLRPFWRVDVGNYVLMGVTSSVVALPVYEPEALPAELAEWRRIRAAHLAEIRAAFAALKPQHRVLLFCHDPTALPFLGREEAVRARLPQVERTIIGHLHTKLIWWKSRVLSGMPPIRFLGASVRRMSTALNEARHWRPFNVLLCPALAGSELLKDGGFYEVDLDPEARRRAEFRFQPMPR
jgi:hypothetical protein